MSIRDLVNQLSEFDPDTPIVIGEYGYDLTAVYYYSHAGVVGLNTEPPADEQAAPGSEPAPAGEEAPATCDCNVDAWRPECCPHCGDLLAGEGGAT